MKTQPLPGTDLTVSNIILGLMRIQEMDDDAVRSLYRTARDSGITMFDHADIYGSSMHGCETRFAQALGLTPAEREEIVIQTKCGIRFGWFDFSKEHIVRSVDESLAALQTDYIDMLLLHRPDSLVEPDEVAAAFDEVKAAGKVKHFGVSNHTPGQIELLRRSLTVPLIVNQVQLSVTHCPIIASGISSNMMSTEQSISRDNGLLDYCRLNDITLQAWSPFQKVFFDGVFLGDREEYPELNDVIDRLAAKYDVPPIAIATGWITRHPARMQVVLGTTNTTRVAGASLGSEVPITREEWYEMFRAAGHIVP